MENTTRPSKFHEQIYALEQQLEKIYSSLKSSSGGIPPSSLEDIVNLQIILKHLAQQAAAIENDLVHMRALAGIGQVVNSTLELDTVLQVVMDTIIRITQAERGFLMLSDEDGEMTIRVARNWEQESINSNEFAISRTIVQRVISSGQPVLTTNAREDPRFGGQESIVAYNLRSILCVPLKVKNDLIGVIYADNRIRSGIFSDADRDLLAGFANQAAVAIENARLFESLRQTLSEATRLKNLMDNIFASIASGVITADIRDKIMLCNRAAESILGRATNELIGSQLEEVLPLAANVLIPQLDIVRKTDKPIIGLEVTNNMPDGSNINWRFNLSPLKDGNEITRGVAIVLDDLTDQKRLEAQRRLFERMVSPAVIEQLDPNSMPLGGKRVDITILFADIRGFTSYSEMQSPEDLVFILNRYLAAAAEAVLAEEGTIDKFLGDAVMAWFNAPIPQKDHTLRAVKTALAIRNAVEKLHKELPPDAHLSFGAGIHYGEAVLGLIGTERRLEYTAIGDSVNSTKRIQENASKNQILISGDAYKRVEKKVIAQPYAPLKVKGKSSLIEVYEVFDVK
ncbi:MAG: GAF domain-containing protein [Anaerolineales bacterium]|nr:GAF domain-containing protein [Anaerolineales bacterium]